MGQLFSNAIFILSSLYKAWLIWKTILLLCNGYWASIEKSKIAQTQYIVFSTSYINKKVAVAINYLIIAFCSLPVHSTIFL